MQNNLDLLFQMSQNLIEGNVLLKSRVDISSWRILDSGWHEDVTSLTLINDVGFFPNECNPLQQIVLVEYKGINHSGMSHSCLEEMVTVEEIVSDIRFLFEVDKDYVAGDEIEFTLQKVVSKDSLGEYGFTFDNPNAYCHYCDNIVAEEFPLCGTDISLTNVCSCEEEE